jgi:voltage-gated potassium channel
MAMVYVVGVIGYMLLYDWNFTDASFMTIITVTSVGFGEVRPLDPAGRWFTSGIILAGIGFLTYGITNLTAFLVEGELGEVLRRNRMENQISKLRDHHIVCGAGRIGTHIAREFSALGQPVVVVDQDARALDELMEHCRGVLVVSGNATDDNVLRKAGVERAAGLASALASDADNLFVTLSARQMNPSLRITARVDNEESAAKVLKAGADKVVCPAHIGGQRMASELLRPTVVDFLDRMTRERDGTLRMEEAQVAPGNALVGSSLAAARIPARVGCVVVALRRRSGEYVFNPRADTILEAHDTLVVIGEVARLTALRELTAPPGQRSAPERAPG